MLGKTFMGTFKKLLGVYELFRKCKKKKVRLINKNF